MNQPVNHQKITTDQQPIITDQSALKEETAAVIQKHVDENITHLTTAALSSALGDIRVMKLELVNKKPKYTPVTTEDELIKALNYIATFSNTNITPATLAEQKQNYSYFILQQSAINMTAWNSLIERRLGKVPQEAKLEASVQFDLIQAGIKASQINQEKLQTPTYTIPEIPTTN